MVQFVYSTRLGRKIRADPLEELGSSTFSLLQRSLMDHQVDLAIELAEYFKHELTTVAKVYSDWLDNICTYLDDRYGRGTGLSIAVNASRPWYEERYAKQFETEPGTLFVQLRDHLYTEDYGSPCYARLVKVIESGETADALVLSEEYRASHERMQALCSDWCWAIMTYLAETHGEEEVGRLSYDTAVVWFRERYDRYFELSAEERLQLMIEWMRGHLSGPGRLGEVEIVDEGDKWVLGFDPCGSGGAMRRGNPLAGDPARSEAPYNFGFTSQPFEWSWGHRGVCYYCSHCAVINEQLAIDVYGHPIRITEYPEDANDKCRWIIYRDVDDIPDEAYIRVGKRRSNQPRK